MMPTDRFERQLPVLLDELAQPRTPDYFDDLLWQTAHTSQRPAWTSPERWLPMLDVARQPVLIGPMPWRPIVALALVAVLVVASAAFFAGAHRLPTPYGPARNGLIAYASGGDIYTADPVTRASKRILADPEDDELPTWSPDGTRFAFIKQTGTYNGLPDGRIFVADAGGGHVTEVTPIEVVGLTKIEFSPDGQSIIIASEVDNRPAITIAASDGSTIRTLDVRDRLPVGWYPESPAYRPVDGSEIMFIGSSTTQSGIYLVDADGSDFRTLVEPEGDGVVYYDLRWSPDGSAIAYTRISPPYDGETLATDQVQVHVVSVSDHVDRRVHTPGARSEGLPIWSPDGSRLIIERTEADGTVVHAVVPADGSGPGVVIDADTGPGGASYEWAPDGTLILAVAAESPTPLLWDPVTGASTTAPWSSGSYPAWQRLAP